MTKNERKELEKMEDLELKKLALALELPMIKSRTELIEGILMKRKQLAPVEKTLHGKDRVKK